MGNSKVDRQNRMEVNAVERGVARYRNVLKSRGLDSKVGRGFLKRYFQSMVEAIRQEVEEGRKATRSKKYTLPLLSLHEEKLAFITLQSIFNLAFIKDDELNGIPILGAKRTLLGREIGDRCWLELCFDRATSRERDIFEALKKKYPRHVAERIAKRLVGKFVTEKWSEKNYDLHLGQFLIELAEKNGLVKGEEKRSGRRTIRFVQLSQEAEQAFAKLRGANEVLAVPMYMPMIVPPRHWNNLKGGGYLSNRKTEDLQLVKHKAWNRQQILRTFEGADLRRVTSAVNALQETAWRTNQAVYRVLKLLSEQRKTLPGFHPIRKLPSKLPWHQRSDPEYDKRKVEYDLVSTRNRKARRFRHIIIPMRIRACEELANAEFFFPYQIDFRGRVYPLPQVFHPQADDLGRALIEFAEGKPLGEEGEFWLKVHLANSYGKDKLSFDERIQWVESNKSKILETAKQVRKFLYTPPIQMAFTTTWWKKADKPWSFLAACLEWADYLRDSRLFKSHLNVSMDGTCNGLQHLSAMGRDEDGGRATNLSDAEKPADIYQEVADRLHRMVQSDYEKGEQLALDWCNNGKQFLKNGRIDRKLAKHATMTTPYGVTLNGIADKLRQDGFTEGLDEPWKGSIFLSQRLERAITDVVSKAKEIMRWLQVDVAELLAKQNQGCSWITPAGCIVIQEYRKPIEVRARVKKHRYTIYRENPNGKVRVDKQKKTIVANFVHSMDAAHMMLTVNALHRVGLTSFAMIHDSFGVHACDIPILNTLLRREFVQMYRQPVLESLFTRVNNITGITLKEPPALGHLDRKRVMQSKYFFC